MSSQTAPNTPIAYAIYGIDASGKRYLSDVKRVDQLDDPLDWSMDDGCLGDRWAGNEALAVPKKVEHPAPGASESPTWRPLALQFDGHRMAALSHLQCMLQDPVKHAPIVEAFLAAPPLSGVKVLEQRLAEIAKAEAGAKPATVELEVWYGPMPESNGKSNFTATLRRKGASPFDTDSYSFSRSEYPERVRYEADFMRYLIGEITERPDCLDYDDQKHSGYQYPPTKQELALQAAQADASEAHEVLRMVEQELGGTSFSMHLVREGNSDVWRYIGKGEEVAKRVRDLVAKHGAAASAS